MYQILNDDIVLNVACYNVFPESDSMDTKKNLLWENQDLSSISWFYKVYTGSGNTVVFL